MVDVEQRALGTLEEDMLTALDLITKDAGGILNVGAQRFTVKYCWVTASTSGDVPPR